MGNAIGINIRKVRELKNLSQDYMSNKLLLSQSAYSNIENGKMQVTDELLKEVAQVLEVSEEVIKGFSDQVIFDSCTNSGQYNTYYINPIEKIDRMYNDMIEQQKEQILTLTKTVEELISALKNK